MPRRRKDSALWAVPPLAGLLILLCFINPALKQAVMGIGLYVVVVLVALVGCIAFFRSGKEPRITYTTSVFAPMPDLASGAKFRDPTLPKFDFTPPVRKPVTTAELMERVRSIDWFQFEKLVALTYRKLGYTVCRRGGANPDGGIDLLIRKDGETSAVQCKQWRNSLVWVRHLR